MFDLVKDLIGVDTPYSVPIASMLFLAVAAALVLLAREVRKGVAHRMDLDAKREMVSRGMSAEEIARVLRAGKASPDDHA